MSCKIIKPLLADYINNDLSKKLEKKVKNHIDKCNNCMEETIFLKSYFTEIKKIETIKSPENLLEKIYDRLEEKIKFKNVFKKLFTPIQFKIYIQTAAVAVIIILTLLFINPIKKLFIHEPQITEEKIENIEKEKNKTFKEIEKKVIKPQELYKISMVLIPEKTENQDPFLKKRGINKNENQSNVSLKENFTKIVELVKSLNGKIISPENYKNTADFNSLIFDIPENKYQIFVDKLNKIGTTKVIVPKDNKSSYKIELNFQK